MVIDSFVIEGISNIGHVRLDVGEMNALIAPNGYQRITDLYAKAHKIYKKGYETTELIKFLNMQNIRNKRSIILLPLEEALGVSL